MDQRKFLKQVLDRQIAKYPHMQAIDLLKLIYQNEFGCGHLLKDTDKGWTLFNQEYSCLKEMQALDDEIEDLGNGWCRVPLSIVDKIGLRPQTLFRIFQLSALDLTGNLKDFLDKVEWLKEWCLQGKRSYYNEEIQNVMEQWEKGGRHPFGHSEIYRASYHPAYRVIKESFCEYLSLFCAIDRLLEAKSQVTVAIDGPCASGKTTLSKMLQQVYDCAVIPMDHFFLRPEQRSPQRLSQPGGNVDYERFKEEIIQPLLQGKSFSYCPYDCSTQSLSQPVIIPEKHLYIVEGSYSLHPTLSSTYDLKVFLSVKSREQLERIRKRNGSVLLERFKKEWIPMENLYFTTFGIEKLCDLTFEYKNG